MDLLGELLKRTGDRSFKGKGRLIGLWIRTRKRNDERLRQVRRGGAIWCDLSIPYEAMVWLEQEEEPDLAALSHLLRSGEIFVDCGANIGLWSITAASLVGPQGKIYSIEPNPVSFDKLRRNIATSRLSNIITIRAAVGERSGTEHLYCDPAHNSSRILGRGDLKAFTDRTAVIPVITLDELMATERRVAGIKIDVEGYEHCVLQGAVTIVDQFKPWICVEFNTILQEACCLQDWDVHRWFSTHNYRPYLMSTFTADSVKALQSDFSVAGYCNILYLPINT